MSKAGSFSCEHLHQHRHSQARVMKMSTPHGEVITPAFMPVGTRAGVNNMTAAELKAAGSQIILGGNTYHMLCAPGMKIIEEAGGMHRFMGWHGPMLTDSGGFQIFSLSNHSCRIDEDGAHFMLGDSSNIIHMTPTLSLETQKIIGADIIMAFDQCTPDSASWEEAQHIMQRTHRWLLESIDYQSRYPNSRYGKKKALFGIIQGGVYDDLRLKSAQFVAEQALDGIAIGGETVGFDMPATVNLLKKLAPILPKDQLRYTMGVGLCPQDLLDVVAQGVDIFDCVAPTRNARHGALYSGTLVNDGHWLRFDSEFERGRLQIKKTIFAQDKSPIMPGCDCATCRRYSRAYLHQLFKKKHAAFTALASIHNIHVLHQICDRMRQLILKESI